MKYYYISHKIYYFCSLTYVFFNIRMNLDYHLTELSQHVVDAGAVPLLVLCIQEPEITLRRISASSLGDICKHSAELAQVCYVVSCNVISYYVTSCYIML